MLAHNSELFAPSQHYQEALTAESRRLYQPPAEGQAMAPNIKEHLEVMLLQAAGQDDCDQCNRLLQYCTGFVGHAVMSAQCTMEERQGYWNRIDKIRRDSNDRHYARGGK